LEIPQELRSLLGFPVANKERLIKTVCIGMSFQDQIETFSKSRLKNVETIVTTVDGKKV